MNWLYWLPIMLLLLGGFGALFLAWYAWTCRAVPGRVPFMVMMLMAGEWSLVDAYVLLGPLKPPGGVTSTLAYIGAAVLPVAWFVLVLEYMGREAWLSRRRLIALLVIPFLTVLLVATNSLHHLVWAIAWIGGRPRITNGPWFWLFIVYAYALTFVGCALLVQRCFDSTGLYRRQALLLLLSGLAPWAASGIELVFFPNLRVSLTSFAFSVMGLLLAWGILRLRLLDLAPMARSALLELMRDGVIVLDQHERVVDANPAAQRLLTLPVGGAIGSLGHQTVRFWSELSERLRETQAARAEVILRFEEQARHFEVRAADLRDSGGHHQAWLINLRDVTEQRRAELAREQALAELKEALTEVKTLTGLLPICAGCKRIRDDQGYWNQIEAYISTHSDARFTHSLCPECVDKFYGNA